MPKTPKPIRCLLVDDHEIVIRGFKNTVATLDDIELAGSACTGEQACEMYHPDLYDVVIMDISMPGMGGLGAMAQILEQYPDAKIIAHSYHEQWEFIRQAVEHGAKGYISKLDSIENIAKGIRALANGRVHYSEQVMHVMIENVSGSISGTQDTPKNQKSREPNSTDPLSHLSPRLKQAFKLLARRLDVKQVAIDMQCDEKTVKNYRSRIVDILGLDHFTEIPAFAEKHRLVSSANE
jgi:DNA-binding NarL/FixJ family response regulator